MLKKIVKNIIGEKNVIALMKRIRKLEGYAVKSYSQEGEDMILRKIFEGQRTGFYVDVGAHHPKRFSNTYYFYKRGWRGINIDAMPGSMKAFNKIRPKDINVEVPISDKEEVLTYYSFNEPAYNGFSKELSEQRIDQVQGKMLLFTKEVATKKLSDVIRPYLKAEQKVDFLSIDVEGFDFKVIKSVDFDNVKPNVILVESLHENASDVISNEISTYLTQFGYTLYAKTCNTALYKFSNKLSKR